MIINLTSIDQWPIMVFMKPKELQSWRKKHGYSQGKLSKALGVDVMTISRWERGLRTIPPFLHLALKGIIVSRESA